jgi:hypothetical protein
VAKVGTSKAGGTISQQAAVHPWLAVDAHGNKKKTPRRQMPRNYPEESIQHSEHGGKFEIKNTSPLWGGNCKTHSTVRKNSESRYKIQTPGNYPDESI